MGQIKTKLRPYIRAFLKTKLGLSSARLIGRLSEYFRYEKSLYERELAVIKLKSIFKSLMVTRGPFKGMVYPSFESVGSSIFPKLLGSYESELHPILEKFKTNNYATIIDVGCAEGYYAIGLAKLFPNCKVIAFDTDPLARALCRKMAQINDVLERVEILEFCSEEWLLDCDHVKQGLLISDCEGYEKVLFTKKVAERLSRFDIIIELHPMHEENIRNDLTLIFEETHHIQIVSSYDDKRKIFDLDKKYSILSLTEKKILIQEGRAFCMDWLILTSKKIA